jgi:type II secretory pathway component PulF
MPLSQAIAGAAGLPPRLVGALTSAERSGFLADACAELAAESQQQYLRYLATLVAVLRTLALAGVALWVAWSVVQQFTGLISDPLGALPGPEGEELRRELQRAMPSLRP